MNYQNLSSFIWSVADLLRGDYKQSDYGKVILPLTVLRRLDCVLEKTKEISILKSMGARDASVMKIFVLEGLTIGAIGTACGLLLGLASCSFIERFGLQLDPDVYYISNLPVTVDGGQFAMVAAISLALSFLATLYPATKASRLSPVDGLREE